jgi:hypothetical protein
LIRADVTGLSDAVLSKESDPLEGYYFKSILFPGENDLSSTDRFAICAYPEHYHQSTRNVYILIHRLGALFKAGSGGGSEFVADICFYGKDLGSTGTQGLMVAPEGLDGRSESNGWIKCGVGALAPRGTFGK